MYLISFEIGRVRLFVTVYCQSVTGVSQVTSLNVFVVYSLTSIPWAVRLS